MTHEARFLFTGLFGLRHTDQEIFQEFRLVGGLGQWWQTAVRDIGGGQRSAIATAVSDSGDGQWSVKSANRDATGRVKIEME